MRGRGQTIQTMGLMILVLLLVLGGCRVPPRTATTSTPTPRPTATPPAKVAVAQRTLTPIPTQPRSALPTAKPRGNVIDVIENIYVPDIITVTVGSPLTWKNLGQQGHDVMASDRSWNAPFITIGGEWSRSFDKPGVYDYYCSAHPGAMLGRIVVVER